MIAQQTLEEINNTTKQQKRLGWFSGKPHTKQANKKATKLSQESQLNKVNRSLNGQHVEFASLAKLEYGLQWAENLIHILAPRLLIIGFVISMVDLLTNGNLLNNGLMVYVWAIIQAMAVDATLPTMWRLAFLRYDERRWIAGSVLLLVGLALGCVVLAALSIQFLQQTESLTLQQTMTRLGIDPSVISYVRSISVVALAAILSVLNRSKVTAIKKASAKQEDTKPLNEETKQERDTGEHLALNTKQLQSVRLVNDTKQQPPSTKLATITRMLNDGMGTTEIAKQVGVNKSYVSQVKAKLNAV